MEGINIPPTEQELAALTLACSKALTDKGMLILRRLLFQRDTLVAPPVLDNINAQLAAAKLIDIIDGK